MPNRQQFACTPADLEAVDHLGLLYVLIEVAGWTIESRERGCHLEAWNGSRSYCYAVGGDDEAEAALRLFKALYSDEPDAIAGAGAFWPPPRPVTRIGLGV